MNVLIAYGTTDGQTAKIAERLAETVRTSGHHVTLVDTAALPYGLDAGSFDVVTAFNSVQYAADPVGVLVIAAIINIPVLIMFALLGASMPRVGGDYVWVSRILNPPLALISNLCMIMGGLLGAAYFAKFFSVFALGPALVAGGSLAHNNTLISWGNSFQTDKAWILAGALVMVALQTYILIRGTKSTFRWQNGAFLIAMFGMVVAFIVLAFATKSGFQHNFNTLNKSFGGGTAQAVIAAGGGAHAGPGGGAGAGGVHARAAAGRARAGHVVDGAGAVVVDPVAALGRALDGAHAGARGEHGPGE